MKHVFEGEFAKAHPTTLRRIRLHGILKEKFGDHYDLAVESPREAIRALTIIVPGFYEEFRLHSFRVVLGEDNPDKGLGIDETNIDFSLGERRELNIIPDIAGNKKGVGKVLAGIALIGLAIAAPHVAGSLYAAGVGSATSTALFTAGTAVSGIASKIGVGLVLGGLSGMLSPSPKVPDYTDREDKNLSYLFTDIVNSVEEGNAVPIALGGPVMCGSAVISSGVDIEDVDLSGGDSSGNYYGESGAYTGQLARDIDGPIYGNKGGKSGGGTARAAVETPNTVASEALARVLDLVSAGEIEGWADPAHPFQNVYFDETPMENADGSRNFSGIEMVLRVGTPDQDYIPGYSQSETPNSFIGRELTTVNPVVATLSNDPSSGLKINRARIIMSFPSLGKANKENGNLEGTTVSYRIGIVPNGGSVQWVVNQTLNEKFNSTYQKAHTVDLPDGGHPYQIRVERLTPDSVEVSLQNATAVEAIIEIIDGKLAYPGSAVVGLTAYARQFGDRIPARGFLLKGAICEVPSNYDPVTRQYSGNWNGTFVRLFTNNPAWILWTALTNEEWGLGTRIPRSLVDKWSLYEIGVYCDGQVPDGYGGTEPRYTFNMWIASREEVYKALQTIASSFRGMLMWGRGSVMATQDSPKTPKRLVTNANVIDGRFIYEGTGRKAIHTVCLVSWVNPADGWKVNVEVVENPELIAKYGWRPIDVFAAGANSRGQARRMGLWSLYTEQYESELVSFQGSFDLADVIPGHIIQISDAKRVGIRMGGRVSAANATNVVLDAPFTFVNGVTYTLYVTAADGTILQRTLTNAAGTTAVATFTTALPVLPLGEYDSVFVLTSSEIGKKLYRVMSISEMEDNIVEIIGSEYFNEKFDLVELNIPFDPLPGSVYDSKNLPGAVQNVVVTRLTVQTPGGIKEELELSFDKSNSPLVVDYVIRWRYQFGEWATVVTASNGTRIPYVADGRYDFIIMARDVRGRTGVPVSFVYGGDGRPIDSTETTTLRVAGQLSSVSEFTGRTLKLEWDTIVPAEYDVVSADWIDPYFKDYELRVETPTGTPLKSFFVTDRYFEISAEMYRELFGSLSRVIRVSVRSRDTYGTNTIFQTRTFTNPAPALVTPTFVTNPYNISFQFAEPLDLDYEGIIVWMSTTPGFTPSTGNQVWKGRGLPTVATSPNTTYYLRYAFFDAFGLDNLVVSSQVTQTTPGVSGIVTDTIPPGIPQNLVATGQFSSIWLEWDNPADTDLAYVEIWEKTESSTPDPVVDLNKRVGQTSAGPGAHDGAVRSGLGNGVTRYYWVRAVDLSGNKSGFSSVATATTQTINSGDLGTTVAFSAPTGLSLGTTIAVDTDSSQVITLNATWTAINSATYPSFSYYEFSIQEASGSFVVYSTANPNFSLRIKANTSYTARVRGVDRVGNRTSYSSNVSTTSTKDTTAPLAPTSPSAVSSLRAAFITWTNVADVDLDSVEIWTNSSNTTVGATKVGTALAIPSSIGGFTHAGLTSGTTYWYFLKSVDTSGNASAFGTGFSVVAAQAGTGDLAVNSVTAAQIVAGTITGDRIQAGSISGDRISTSTSLPGSITIGSTGVTLETVSTGGDPATGVNAGTTLIQPGKILLSGATTLASWRDGGDLTKISGGAIQANTIDANKLTIGNRGLTVAGLEFQHNNPSTNSVSWTSGSIIYVNDSGTATTANISSSSVAYGGSTVYIYWIKGGTALQATTSSATAFGADNVVLATYRGGTDLAANYGRTIIDGSKITTGSIQASQIAALTITSGLLASGAVTAGKISAGAISADTIGAGTISVAMNLGGSRIVLDGANTRILISD